MNFLGICLMVAVLAHAEQVAWVGEKITRKVKSAVSRTHNANRAEVEKWIESLKEIKK